MPLGPQGSGSTNEVVVGSAARTTSANSRILGGYGPAKFLACSIAVTAVTGTTPTLDVVVEDTLDGINFFTIATFTQAVATTSEVKRVVSTTLPFTDRLRVRWTIGGTATPTFTFSVSIFAKA
jgi:hypothetical protein